MDWRRCCCCGRIGQSNVLLQRSWYVGIVAARNVVKNKEISSRSLSVGDDAEIKRLDFFLLIFFSNIVLFLPLLLQFLPLPLLFSVCFHRQEDMLISFSSIVFFWTLISSGFSLKKTDASSVSIPSYSTRIKMVTFYIGLFLSKSSILKKLLSTVQYYYPK